MGEVITVDRIMTGWGTLDYKKKKQADHWLPWISSLFCHCKCLPPSSLSPFPLFYGPLAFIPPSFLREPSPQHPGLSSSLWDTCTHHPIAITCCLCSGCYYLCLFMAMRGCLPTQTQNNILIACPICYILCQTQNRSDNQKIVVEWLCKPPF